MRAVEQGIALVRVANTGITAYIDEYGRIEQKLDLGSKGILDIELRKPAMGYTTYTRYGDWLIWLTLCFIVVLFVIRVKLSKS
jgi:apolipoprotein N-acyltransferase